MLERRRAAAFAIFAGLCAVVAIAITAVAVVGAGKDRRASERAVTAARPQVSALLDGDRPFVAFRSLDRRHPGNYGRFAVAPLDGTQPGRAILAGPVCERLSYRGGAGVCLGRAGLTTFPVSLLDASLHVRHTLELAGVPSRVRLSPDGRYAGITAFVTGHSYAQPGNFSTGATIVDVRSGRRVGDLEHDFTVTHDGAAVTARDRNYWGLTFARDGDTFYATLATGGRTWLIRGSIRERRAHTIHENVECPSLSPDGTRIGYKKAVGHDPTVWRFHVLDLASGKETALAETRPIDDQLEWLDDEHLLYREGETVWVVRADGTGRPRKWLDAADSPAIVSS